MKHLLIAALMLTSLNAEFLAQDKAKHAAAGLIVYGGCVAAGEVLDMKDYFNTKTCVLASVSVGLIKEGYDALGHGNADAMDAVATFAPALAISYTLEF